jgi:hypothetical protein
MPLPSNSTRYYRDNDRYPKIVKALLKRVLIYVAEEIYTEEYAENPINALERIILSDIQAGDEVALRDSIKVNSRDGNEPPRIQTVNEIAPSIFEKFTKNIPFTGYNIDDFKLGDIKNYHAYSGDYYGSEIGRKGSAWQEELDIQFVSFFNKADDYQRALSRMHLDATNFNRLRVPITLNQIQQTFHEDLVLKYDTSFPIDVLFEVNKGSLSNQFEQYLTKNKIWNFVFNAKIKFYNYEFSEYLGNTTVEEMVVRLSEEFENGTSNLLNTSYVPDPPILVSSIPENNAINIPTSTTSLMLTFNNSMNEDEVVSKIYFTPNIIAETIWSMDSKILYYTLNDPLTANTAYSMYIPYNIKDMFGNNMEEDITITFTTGA